MFLYHRSAKISIIIFLSVTTTTSVYEKHCYKISAFLSIILCCVSLLATTSLNIHDTPSNSSNTTTENSSVSSNLLPPARDISPAGLYAIYVELLVLMYTVVPLPLLGTLSIGIAYR